MYCLTDDEVSRGGEQVDFTRHMYPSVIQPNHLETVVVRLRTGPGGRLEKWKYTRYFDTAQFWSDPADEPPPDHLPPEVPPQGEDIVTLIDGDVDEAGTKTATTTVKTRTVPDQIEVYNVARDPLELRNLADSSDPRTRATVAQLRRTLRRQRELKRRVPSSGEVPGQPRASRRRPASTTAASE